MSGERDDKALAGTTLGNTPSWTQPPTTEAGSAALAGDLPGPTPHDPRSTPHAHDPRPRATPHEHAHAHALAHADDTHEASAGARPAAGAFPHEKLDAYRVAVKLAALAHRLAAQVPRGYRNVADHLQRAASNTVLLLGEGANRWGAALKRQRFGESRGECGEVAAAADLLQALGIGSPADTEELKHLAGRVSAMLTRLLARLQ
jgi:four helix bundle protein